MTILTPDVDVDNITHLDFAPPCDVKVCDQEATWVATWKIPEPVCCNPIELLCDRHLNAIRIGLAHDLIIHCKHGPIGRVRDVLSRIEPL
jgi:hypothetical protein